MRLSVKSGAGFLGSHLCEQLLGLNQSAICVDNFYTGFKSKVIHLMENEILDLYAITA